MGATGINAAVCPDHDTPRAAVGGHRDFDLVSRRDRVHSPVLARCRNRDKRGTSDMHDVGIFGLPTLQVCHGESQFVVSRLAPSVRRRQRVDCRCSVTEIPAAHQLIAVGVGERGKQIDRCSRLKGVV